MRQIVTQSHHQAGVAVARVHAYPCAMTLGSLSITPFLGITNDRKPSPRRDSRIS
jgi:hypothetical protein